MQVNAPPYAASSLPAYTPNAQPDERTISVASTSTQNVPSYQNTQDYQYKNGHLLLNLGPKSDGVFRKVYGWNGVVQGYVQVKKNTTNVLSLVVSIEGHVTTGLTERGFLTEQTKTTVLRLSQILFDSSPGQESPVGGAKYAFSFALPSYVYGGTLPLPPTFATMHAGVGADATYCVKVEMVRKGRWRQNEKLKAFFFYLPRTYAPLPSCQTPANDTAKSQMEDASCQLRVIPVLPRGGTSTSAASLCVTFALTRPLIYAAGTSIPFLFTINSGRTTEALPSLFSCLSVQLIRVTTLFVGQRKSPCETVIGGGEVFRIEERGNTRTMFGSVACTRPGQASWRVKGIEVKYLVRVRLAPRGDMPSIACALPTYEHEEVVELRTHQHLSMGEDDETAPALCRLPHPIQALAF